MDATYAEIWEANSSEVQRRYPLLPDRLTIMQRVHAITMRRLANSPGWWKDDDSTDEAVKLSLEDVKRDLDERGLKGVIERWAMKKIIEAIILILTSYLRHEYEEESASSAGTFGAADFDGKCEAWAADADLVLQQQ
jgi:hypothetical protein